MSRVSAAGCAAVLAGAVLAGCTGNGAPGGGKPTGSAGSSSGARGSAPLANPEGLEPGLVPTSSAQDQVAARDLIAGLATKGRGPKTGYDRKEFGSAWMDSADGVPLARNGCDTRNDVLKRDGQGIRFRSGSDCVVVSMTLPDPYTGKALAWRKEKAAEVQIDHVVPLSYAWQMGAARWGKPKRQRLANDVLNLLPVSGPANSAKGDSGPASWLPPNKAIRCAYAVTFAQVALKYELPVTEADKRTMLTQCGG
ncbi:HNH endonuclease family protein [Streptomyces sp. NBC_00347]|uniref:HNH endonuclease family protein n=1 Tax=Streptomyces sp. NBC_00347 TaxID=2975721 RepID=UPI002256EEB2|nr:HNH endonuclease family protein [Streptomyces sp. NBC_00347]MCX5124823.1 HNH endonuclease family protein [Streptomyces sp. NBC_00347]